MHTFIIKPYEQFYVLRDDLLAGGTKRRALDLMLTDLEETDIAYAGTIFGHGALALAHACTAAGKQAHLYLSCNNPNHSMVNRIRNAGGIIERCEPLPVEQLLQEIEAGYIFPLGFDTPAFHSAMVRALAPLDIAAYPEIWCAAVSGTLANTIKAVFPDKEVRLVGISKSTEADFHASEKYHQTAKLLPPYPSCPYTDAKLWAFAASLAKPGALIWNTAG